ncbi:MAG: helix-turn-helix transcriptional regulator [Pseudomonadota bacterium]
MSTIKLLREAQGMTQASLAALVQTSQPQIRRLEAGERQLSKEWAERLAPHLGVSAAELMFGPGQFPSVANDPASNARLGDPLPDQRASIPVYGQAVGGIDGEFAMNGERLEDVFAPPSLSAVAGAYAVYVCGDSMEPRYFDGEIVFVNPRKRVRRGDFVIAQITDEEHGPNLAYVKRFIRWNARELVLAQYNPAKEMRFAADRVVSVHLVVMGGAV